MTADPSSVASSMASSVASSFTLPDRPVEMAGQSVAAWQQPVTIDTYAPHPPSAYPAFLDRRVYQGSSGTVYPLPFYERIDPVKRPQAWDAVHLENEYVRLMVLPQLGGRVHVGYDKIAGYDFFFRNQVIKPALIGLTGPWIAGGVEFNWPQHHRPATYLPTDCTIERAADGSVTVWCSDHDPFTRMKGMHGLCLRPGSSLIELKVRLYNRTDEPQTFLWWANVAPRATTDYQSFFPTDVAMVADHAKRAVTAFPRPDRPYYGIDYRARADDDPDAGHDRLDWYRNIDVPTSYMALGSRQDFFGGYDHGAGAGFVHVADHQISVGKKQWTWGHSDFGRAWCRNLTDDDSVYVELMAGVFTDNQPDFSHLAPGETKVFSQYWFPINELGPVQQAGIDGALRVRSRDSALEVGFAATRVLVDAALVITSDGGRQEICFDARPGEPWTTEVELPGAVTRIEALHEGTVLLSWTAADATASTDFDAATEPAAPQEVASVEELFLIGAHLEQYRHATRSPEPYWREALRRDPGHAAANTALALRRYRDARYGEAETLLHKAIARLTALNPNASDTTASYVLGLVLMRLGRAEEAYDAFGRALWTRAWRAPAGFQLALLDAAAGRHRQARQRLEDVLRTEPDHLQARCLQVLVLRRVGAVAEADRALAAALELDPLHWWTRDLAGHELTADPQTCYDIALEYRRAGENDEARRCLVTAWANEAAPGSGAAGVRPLVDLLRGELLTGFGRPEEAAAAWDRSRTESAAWCFPGRLDDHDLLRRAIERDPDMSRPYALLGTWLYAHSRATEAIRAWRRAVDLDPTDVVSWRNLGLAIAEQGGHRGAARLYDTALGLAPHDARLIFERDQLDARAAVPLQVRRRRLTEHRADLADRDDAAIELAHVYLSLGEIDAATNVIADRAFQPWEGGEGQALRAWDRACLAQARRALSNDDPAPAAAWVGRALDPPDSLGEKRHPLANSALLHLVLGDARAASGDRRGATQAWREAAEQIGDFVAMSTTPYSESTAASVLALRRLGRDDTGFVAGLRAFVDDLATRPATIDYFATSLPDLLLFAPDPQASQDLRVQYLSAQLDVLAGDLGSARRRRDEILAIDPHHADAVDLPMLIELAAAATEVCA